MVTTVEIGVVIAAGTTVAVLVIETAIQAYRRYKDNTSDEIEQLKKENAELEEKLGELRQYFFG